MFYCGSNPTALSSQLQISDALIRLMERKPYSGISVSELCREAGISRQTFYALFSSMENVVLFTLREKACELPHTEGASFSADSLCRCFTRYICGNRDLLRLLVTNNVGYLLYSSLYDSLSHCCGCQDTGAAVRDRQYAANFLAGGLTGVVREYCLTDPPPTDEVLYDMLCRLFRGEIFG